MVKPRPILKIGVTALAAALFLFIGNFVRASSSTTTTADMLESFSEALAVVEANYAGDIDYENVIDASMSEMLHVLDPHSNYYDKEEFLKLRSDQQSEYFGIGATVTQRGGKTYIQSVFANAPAMRAGLRYGDQIAAVNGQLTDGWSIFKVTSQLKGPRGTQVLVSIIRPGEAAALELNISRDAVSFPSLSSAYMIKPGVGYVWLRRGFARTSGDELSEAIKKLKQQGMNQLIFDLRDNPGGLVSAAVDISNMFLSRGQTIVTLRSRQGNLGDRSYEAKNAAPETMPLAVLVNSNSASASEIVSGAFQDHDRAIIVGEVTFGKGLVQNIFPMSNGTGLTLTTGKYYTPSGRLIQREYSGKSLYDYYRNRKEQNGNGNQNSFQTDGGRKVTGGGGITPDTIVKGRRFTPVQARLQDPIFMFVRELINGQTPGLAEYKIDGVNYDHILKSEEFPVTDKVIGEFKKFLEKNAGEFQYKFSPTVVNDNLEYLKLAIRSDAVSAAYGPETAQQVLLDGDPQVLKGIAEVEKAKPFIPKKTIAQQ